MTSSAMLVVMSAMRHVEVPEAAGRLRDLGRLRLREPGLRAALQGAFVSAIAGCFTVGLPAIAQTVGS